MPKYLVHGTYTEQGLKGLLKDGGSKRREVVEQLVTGMGGRLEALYFAFGGDDLFIIADVPSTDINLMRSRCAWRAGNVRKAPRTLIEGRCR